MNKFLFFIGFLILAAMAVIAVGPSFVDWSAYRGTFEREASRLIGREVRVGGDVQLRVVPSPYLQFENLRIASADGRFVEPFMKAGRFKLMLEIPPLLKGTFKARRVEVERAEFNLTVNKEGKGSWTAFKSANPTLLPKAVVLPDVRVINSVLRLKTETTEVSRSFELNEIEGVFSAASLRGPFKFGGTIGKDNTRTSLRISTGPMDETPSGSRMEMIASIGVPSQSATYRIKGDLDADIETPRFNGELEGAIALKGKDGKPAQPFEVKSRVSLTTTSLQIGDIVAGFETNGRPQVISGDAVVSWRKSLNTVADFSAAWIDLNRFDTSDEITGLALARRLREAARWVGRFSGNSGSVQVSGRLKQGLFRDGSINDMKFGLSSAANGRLKINTIEASLPGAGRLNLSGDLKGDSDLGGSFDGEVSIRGGSLKRFSEWVLRRPTGEVAGDFEIKRDGFFSLRSGLRSSSNDFQLSKADVEFSGTRFGGDLYRAFDDRSGQEEFNLSLESQNFELSNVGLNNVSLSDFFSSLLKPTRGGSTEASRSLVRLGRWIADHKRSNIKLGFGALQLEKELLRDVRLRFGVAENTLYLADATFNSDDGYDVALTGRVSDLSGQAEGRFDVSMSAKDQVGAAALLGSFAPDVLSADETWRHALLKQVVPLKLAGKLTLNDAKRHYLSLSGDAGPARLVINGKSTAPIEEGQYPQMQADLLLTSDNGRRLQEMLQSTFMSRSSARQVDGPPKAGAFALSFNGVADQRIKFVSRLSTSGMGFLSSGEMRLRDKRWMVRSKFDVQAKDAALALGEDVSRALGVGSVRDVQSRRDLNLSGLINRDDDVWRVAELRGDIGGQSVAGNLDLDVAAQPAKLSGKLQMKQILLTDAMSVILLDGDAINASGAEPVVAGRRDAPGSDSTIWSDRAISFGRLNGVEGILRISADRLQVRDRFRVEGFQSEVRFSPERFSLEKISGRLGAGKISGRVSFDAKGAGVGVNARFNVNDVSIRGVLRKKPAIVAISAPPRLSGRVSGNVTFSGEALSFRGLATVLKGAANVRTSRLKVDEFSPGFIQTAAVSTLASRRKLRIERLKQDLLRSLRTEALELGDKTFKVRISDGIVSLPPLSVETAVARVTGKTLLSLDNLRLDSSWRVVPKAVTGAGDVALGIERKPLPALSVVFAGPLGGEKPLPPQFSAGGLLRELTVRRLEQDVGELEKLRQREQEIAKELERRRKAEEERLLAERKAEEIKLRALAAQKEQELRRKELEALVPPRPVLIPEPLPPIRN